MKDLFKSKFFYVITFLTLAAVIIPTVLCAMWHSGIFRNAVNTVMTPLRNLSLGVVDALDGYASYFTDFDRIVEENERLRTENASLRDEVYKSRELEEQYDWISEYLELKMQHSDFIFTPASVTGRESGNYSTVFMLDEGSASGVERNMPVVTSDGVVGYISEVGVNWSKACSMLESSSSVGAVVERSDTPGVVKGDYFLAKEGLCRLEYLESDADIKVGDRILTSGYGSAYPRGLIIGYVDSIEKNEFSRSITAYVKVAAFDGAENGKLSRVMIITDYETSEK